MVRICELHKDAQSHIGSIEVAGWIRTVRESKTLGFIELSDGSSFKPVQVVFEQGKLSVETVKALSTGCAIQVRGILEMTPEAPQPFEIKAEHIEILGECDSTYPLQKKRHTLEFLRTIQHLRPRTNTFQATFRVRSIVAQAIHRFFGDKGFVYVHTPIITGSDCEGAGEMFQVTTFDLADVPKTEHGNIDYTKDFFGTNANLTVSGQLYGEAYAMAFRDIYTFGPTFRAEKSNTPRHAAEFWMIEPEMAFCDLGGYMDIAEEMVKYIIADALEKAPQEMEFFNKFIDPGLIDRLNNVLNSEFARVSYTEAIEILKASGVDFTYPVYWGCDLQTEHERYLTEKHFKRPAFVTDYPKEIKAFYMRLNDDNKTVAAADLLVPGVGELIGGSQREERLELLEQRMEELKMDCEPYKWYLELRRFGGVKHSGFGLGFERMIMYLTGMSNIRDVIPFPRTTGMLEF